MNILNRLTIKNLKLNRKRTIVSIIGIMLSTALITAVSSMFFTTKNSLINYVKKSNGDYHYLFMDVNKNNFNQFELNNKIEKINYVKNYGYSLLEGIQNKYKPYLFVKGYTSDSLKDLGINLIEGEMPKLENEILIPSHLKYNGGVEYKIGDTITLKIGERLTTDGSVLNQSNPYLEDLEKLENFSYKTYKVVGIMERPSNEIEPYSAPGYTVITYVNEKDINDKADIYVRYTKLGIKNYYKTTANILGVNPDYYEYIFSYSSINKDYELKFNEVYNNKKYNEQKNNDLVNLESNMFGNNTLIGLLKAVIVVIIIIIFTSVFCIKNSFDISITEKIRQYGMLRSIGATKRQIKKNVYYEALILSFIGIPLGIILGLLATLILVIVSNYLLSISFDDNFKLTFTLSFLSILFSILLGFITIYLSAFKSAKKASKITPITAIRNNEEIKIKKNKIKTPKIINLLFKIGGVISYKNLKRSRKKYRTTVISIVVSIIVYLAVNSFISIAFQFINYELPTDEYNISITYKENNKNKNIDNKIKNISKIENVINYSNIKYIDYSITNPKYNKEYFNIYKTIKEKSYYHLEILIVNKSEFERYANEIGIDKNNNQQGILVNTIYDYYIDDKNTSKIRQLEVFNYKKGDIINGNILLDDNLINFSFEISCITSKTPIGYSNNIYSPIIVISEENKNIITDTERYNDIYINSNNSDKTYDELKVLFQENDINIQNIDEQVRTTKSFYILIAIFLYGFITVIALIGITNIFNTITTNMKLRQREFATLRCIGMTNKEFNRMIRLETLFYTSKSLLIGLPIGIILTYIIWLLFSDGELILKYKLPIKAILIVCIVIFILIFLIMKFSLNKIKNQNTIETIRNENI